MYKDASVFFSVIRSRAQYADARPRFTISVD